MDILRKVLALASHVLTWVWGTIFAVLIAASLCGQQIIKFLEYHEKLAGWAQAIGTLLAIYVTWAISNYRAREQANIESRRQAVKAKALATLLALRVAKVQACIQTIRACLQSTNFGVNVYDEIGQEIALDRALFSVEFETDLLLQIEALGTVAADMVAKLAFLVEDYNSFMAGRFPHVRTFTGPGRFEYIELAQKKLTAIDQLASGSWSELAKIAEAAPMSLVA